ncbi:MAG TPA: aminoglycoside phosphotransferase family protein [Mycobacteriales bacterium]|nr:aminoglycoside phosphotransferase family protein [Mycobacteriales bacterium]
MPRMHADEVEIGPDLVRRLLRAQLPRWADLPLTHLSSAGTDNTIYRLGDDLAVRLRRRPGAAGQVDKEYAWLPLLAPHLPAEVPVPLALGGPGEGYPWTWSVCRWVHGDVVPTDGLPDAAALACDLAAFVVALRGCDATGGPPPGDHNFGRGVPLAARDALTRRCLAELGDLVDAAAVLRVWEAALRAPVWDRPPVWVHGDLQSGNLVARDGRLRGVIDFGGLGVGDPAVDLLPAWNLLPATARATYRAATGADDATWERGRAWALSVAVVALPYYLHTNPAIVAQSWHVVAEVLADAA